MAAARKARSAIPISATITGCGATARSRPSTRRSCTAFAPTTPRRIRARCRPSGAPAILSEPQIVDVAEYVLSLSGKADDKAAAERGAKIFAANCAACHGADGKGNPQLGAPNLTDELWLYAGDKATVMETIRNSRGGVMPAWAKRLDPETVKELAIYVHSLGGGR